MFVAGVNIKVTQIRKDAQAAPPPTTKHKKVRLTDLQFLH